MCDVTKVTFELLCLVVAMGSFCPYAYRCKDINHINKGEYMTATKLRNGAWEISAMISDPIAKSFAWSREIGERLETKVFYGYTKREALALFKAQVIEQGFKIAK